MKFIDFFLYIIIINLSLFSSLDNPANLNSDYPFSIKKDQNTVIIFSNNAITTFDLTKTQIPQDPLTKTDLSGPAECLSGEEKGGIYFSNYYYTSCYVSSSDTTKFQIKVYDLSFNLVYTFPSSYAFTSPIRFFLKEEKTTLPASPPKIEATWLNNGIFNIAKFIYNSDSGVGTIEYSNYLVEKMARDIDCIYISQYDRIVCAFGIKKVDTYTCSVNIFTEDNSFISNLKTWEVCNDHQSRKLRQDSIDKTTFYYYFVDTDFNAYILPLKMTGIYNIQNGSPIKILNGCDDNQNSFDFANEKFNGYFVFSCVESRFKKTIKIQLFKLDGSKIIFYEDKNVDKPFEFDEDELDSEFAKVNFIVLKSSLNFGFLSYRTIASQGRYTIFNQPSCIDYTLDMNTQTLYQNKEIVLNFNNVIKNDNYDGGKIQIVEQGEGMDVSVLPSFTDVKFISKDYITGKLSFTFRAENTFYKSDKCTADVEVKECYPLCETCSNKGTNFFSQLCEQGCKRGSYPMLNFPIGQNDNCCEKGVDCPNYLYYNYIDYEICHISCLACNYGSEYNCLSCYNEKSLQNYTNEEQSYIIQIKSITTSLWYYWENDEHKKCVNMDNEPYVYLDEEELTYKPCYISCEKCTGPGDSTNNSCTRCNENSGYYHIEDINSINCYNKAQAPKNYYVFDDNYVPGELAQSRYWTGCNYVCATCIGGSKQDCTSCNEKYYPKCSEKNNILTGFECYDKLPDKGYYFDKENKCYADCDSSCETCDKAPDLNYANCLSCNDGVILFNRNCYIHCPITHFELDHKVCVDKCPDYTLEEKTVININEYYWQCYNCKDIDQCIYLGKQEVQENYLHVCINCNDIPYTFISNNDYNILDDCYELCDTCEEKGDMFNMNCLTCRDNQHCLVHDYNNCITKGTIIDNYFLKINPDGSCEYEKCYISCKSCTGSGDSENNNCIYCDEGYQPDPQIEGNCVEICKYYWYINPLTNKYTCTEDASCPRLLPYLAELTKQCVADCIHAYSFNSINLYKYKKTCVTQCPDNTMKDFLYYVCHTLDDSKEVFSNIQNYISYQTSIPKTNFLMYSTDKTKYFHFYNTSKEGLATYEESAKGVGTSLIDLSYCLATLRRQFGYSRNEIYYIGIMDVIREDTSAPQFEFSIYDHRGVKLDINLCQNDIIVINKSFVHNKDMDLARYIKYYYNYDIVNYNKENKFFCDICTIFEYDKDDPYDVILNDRYNLFYQNKEYYFCESICDSSKTKVYLNDSRVECVCKGKKSYTALEKENFDQFNKLDKKCHDWFLQYMKCGNNMFNKKFFSKNYANVLMFLFVIGQITSIFLFFFISKKNLKNYLTFVISKKQKLRKKYLEENPISYNDIQNSTNRGYTETTSKFKNTVTNSQTNSELRSKKTSSQSHYSKSRSSKSKSNYSHTYNSSSKNSKSQYSSNRGSSYNSNETGNNSASNSNSKTHSHSQENSNNESNENENESNEGSNTKSQKESKSGSKSKKETSTNKNESKGKSSSHNGSKENGDNNEENGDKEENDEDKISEEDENESSNNNDDDENEENEENSNANPPRKQKRKPQKSSNKDENLISIEDIDDEEKNNNNKNKEEAHKNKKEAQKIKKEEQNNKKEEQKNEKEENKKPPKTAFQKYAKRFLLNRKDYVDNSYHEDSYDFKLEKNWRERGPYDESEEEEEESEEHEESETHKKESHTHGTSSKKTENTVSHKTSSKKSKSDENTKSQKSKKTENTVSHKSSSKQNNKTEENTNSYQSGEENSESEENTGSHKSTDKNSKNKENTISHKTGSKKEENTASHQSSKKNSKSEENSKSHQSSDENSNTNSKSISNKNSQSNTASNKNSNSYTNSNSKSNKSNTKSYSHTSKRGNSHSNKKSENESEYITNSGKTTSKSRVLSINSSRVKTSSKYQSKTASKITQSEYISDSEEDNGREEQLYPQLVTDKRTFSDAIKKFENKSFCYLYWYILKKRHRVVALFIKRDKYDFFTIKLSYLILSFTCDFFFITLFFLDPVIRYVYKKKKHIEPLCTILLGIGTPALSHAIMRGLDYLMDENLKKKFKDYEKNNQNIEKNYMYTLNSIIKEYIKAIIIYYSIIFFSSLFVWYMVGTFIGTFYYVQKMWLIILGINFLMSNFFPLIFYLIAVKFQYEGIKEKDIKLFRRGMTMQKM